MSESTPHSPENTASAEKAIKHEHYEGSRKQEIVGAEKQSNDTPEKINSLRHKIEEEAVVGKDVKLEVNSGESNSQADQPGVYRELKQHMLDRTMVSIRKQLSLPSRQLSKIVHTKPVEAISAVGEKTVARPVGIIGGGLAALVGSALAVYMSRHYGYRYNYLLFVLLFISGYMLATIVELGFILAHRLKHGKKL